MNFSILIIEDEKAHVDFLSKIFNSKFFGTGFSTAYAKAWDQAKSEIENRYFDLIIADLYIYEHISEQEEGNRGDFYCLEPLLEITEKSSPPIPIIVYTSRADLRSLRAFQSRIWDFWEKGKIDSEFATFRIRKVKELIEKESPNSIICRAIKEKVNEKVDSGDPPPFHEPVINLLETYEKFISTLDEKDQIEALISPLSTIASEYGFSETFRFSFGTLAQLDTPVSSFISSYRPHLFHSIHTFLMGYFLFNLANIDWVDILGSEDTLFKKSVSLKKGEDVEEQQAKKEAWEEINIAWFAASLLHDISIPIQYSEKIVSRINNIVNGFEIVESSSSLQKRNYRDEDFESLIESLSELQSPEDFKALLKSKKDSLDHGLGSAIYLNTKCIEEAEATLQSSYAFHPLKMAAQAAALHTSFDEPGFPTIDFIKLPILGMLILCDAIQAWDRDKVSNSFSNGDYIFKVQLYKFDIINRNNLGPEIDIQIRYTPYSHVAYHQPSNEQAYTDLHRVLQSKVINPLRKVLIIECAKEKKPKFTISFKISNRDVENFYLPVK